MIKRGASDLRTTAPSKKEIQNITRNPIYIVVDNVLDTYNVGAIFRLADAVAAQKVILCGKTETPPHTRIKKASINTSEWIDWEYAKTAQRAIYDLRLKIKEIRVIAIEQHPKSIPYNKADYRFPIALVVGNETEGISKEALLSSDMIVELPLWGVNKSLNVMVSLGIVLYGVMKEKNP